MTSIGSASAPRSHDYDSRVTLAELYELCRGDARVNRRRSGSLGALSAIVFRIGQFTRDRGMPLRLVYLLTDLIYLKLLIGCEIPASISCGPRLVLPHAGRGIVINPGTKLGSDVCLMHQVTLGTAFPELEAPAVGDRVFVGAKASVIGGVTVGEESIIAAHALVTSDVPPRSLAKGVPARCTPLGDEMLDELATRFLTA
jgi:serine O-acetyltransferase